MGVGRTLRGAWWRRDLNLGLGLVVAVATAATAAAPTFAAAATSALVRDRVAAADPLDTDMSWVVGVEDPAHDLAAAVDTAHGLGAEAEVLFDPPAVSASALVTWPDAPPQPPTVLAWRENQCAQVVVTGECPSEPGEVLLPAGSAAARTRPAGDSFVLRQPAPDGGATGSTIELTVVGTWAPRDLGREAWYDPARWSADGELSTLPDCDGSPIPENISSRLGPMLTDFETLTGLADVTVYADAALTGTSDVDRVRRAAAQTDEWQAAPTQPASAPGTCVAAVSEADIDGVVGPIDDDRSRLERQGVGAAAGAVLVGVLAVVLITTIAGRRRRQELAVLKLRGVRGLRLVRETLAEPLVLLTLGTVVGVPLGWAVGALAARSWLGGDVATAMPASVWPLAGLVYAATALGIVAGTWRTLREPVHRQLRPDRRRATTAAALLGRVAVFVIAAVGIYQLRHGGDDDPPWWALSLPVVVGLAAGVIAGWLVRLVAGAMLASSRARRGSGLYLGSRRLVRSGDLLTFLPFAMAAIVLVVVAGGAWSTGTHWREGVALLRTGGPVAVDSGRETAATLAATRRADPDGQWLMTALSFPDDSGRVYRRLFVDTTRWDRVVAPAVADAPTDTPSDLSDATLAAMRERPDDATGRLRGTRMAIEVDADVSWFRDGQVAQILVGVVAADGADHVVSFAMRRHGAVTATSPAPFCAEGCAVESLRIDIPGIYASSMTGPITLDELRLGSADLLALDWRAHPAVRHQLTVRPTPDGGLALRSFGGSVSLRLPLRTEPDLPVVVAGGLDLDDPEVALEPGTAMGIDGRSQPVRVVGEVDTLPLIGAEGVLGDLVTFLADEPSVPPLGEVVVVARADTPDTVLAALRTAGVDTGQTRTVEATSALLEQDPYAQGLRFFWLVAALVAAIAVCTVGTALVSQRPARSHEGAALRVVGLRGRQLRSAVAYEVGTLGVLIALCGWLAGWASSWATLPVLPLGRPAEFEPAPVVSTAWTMGLLPAAVAAAAVSVAALSALIPMTVRTRPAALRTGGD